MTLDTDKRLSDLVIMVMHRYLGEGFMCRDNRGKTVYQVIKEWESEQDYCAESICEKIAIAVLGGNLPDQVAKIKYLKFL